MSTWDAELERSELSESFPTDFVGLDSGRVNSILRTIEEGILLWNTDGKLMYANPAALAHFNDSEGRSTGCHWAWLAQRCASAEGLPCDGECFPLDRVLAGDADARPVLLQVRCAEDKVRWLRVHTQPLTDTHGAVTGAVCSSVDVTRQVEQENSLKLQAHFDTLTGLPNRVLFSDRLDQALAHARRHRENLAVCMLDLDGFKIVNDSFGHSSGDQLLREVASRLHDSLRGDDTAARLGGDEFALLIGDLNMPSCGALSRSQDPAASTRTPRRHRESEGSVPGRKPEVQLASQRAGQHVSRLQPGSWDGIHSPG